MINNNVEDRQEMAKEIAEVRKTGMTNMFDLNNVIYLLDSLGYTYTADYLAENRGDYMSLLKLSGEM